MMRNARPRHALLPAVLALASLAGCRSGPGPWQAGSAPEALAMRVEKAHGIEAWRRTQAVAADLAVSFGGRAVLTGAMVYDHHRGRARIDVAGGPTLVFDGGHAWVSPASAALPMARFHLLTWPYFLAAPFKLRDPGSRLLPRPPSTMDGVLHYCARLEFDPGAGDTPDDWYVLYVNRHGGRLAAMAYIVTYGMPVEQAEADPHAIVYEDYARTGGVLLSRRWRFLSWNEADGPHGDPIGEVILSNLRFVSPPDGSFDRPPDSREDPPPAPAPEP